MENILKGIKKLNEKKAKLQKEIEEIDKQLKEIIGVIGFQDGDMEIPQYKKEIKSGKNNFKILLNKQAQEELKKIDDLGVKEKKIVQKDGKTIEQVTEWIGPKSYFSDEAF